MTALLSAWRKQTERERSGSRRRHPSLKQASLYTAKAPNLRADRHSSTRAHTTTTSCSSIPFEIGKVTAGIPVSPANTALGNQLWQVLRDQPVSFVAQAQSHLEEVAAQPSADTKVENVLAAARTRGLLEDILYYWALAEAYLAEPDLQSNLR